MPHHHHHHRQLCSATRRLLTAQLCSAGRPALYKLQAAAAAAAASDDNPSSSSSGSTQQVSGLAIGQSGIRQVGEDAAFVRHRRGGAAVGFGVADGVGGWRERGIDPGRASLALLGACSDALGGGAGADASVSLKSLLASAHRSLLTSRRDLVGSTTVCLARLTPGTGLLEVANLGDSGLCVMDSELRVKLRTRFQANMGGVFNCPMQLAFPSELSTQYPKPEDCELYSVTMGLGDIALMATDGLWDNLYQQTIEEIFRHAFRDSADSTENPLMKAAKMLVDAATYLSAEQSYFSPFCQNAKAAGLKYSGGKEDDITVVLARLCPGESEGSAVEPPVAKL